MMRMAQCPSRILTESQRIPKRSNNINDDSNPKQNNYIDSKTNKTEEEEEKNEKRKFFVVVVAVTVVVDNFPLPSLPYFFISVAKNPGGISRILRCACCLYGGGRCSITTEAIQQIHRWRHRGWGGGVGIKLIWKKKNFLFVCVWIFVVVVVEKKSSRWHR